MPIRAIAVTVTRSTRRIMSVPAVQSMEQLRGQPIAISVVGSGLYNSAVLAFEHFGLGPQEVTWIGVGSSGANRLLALQQGAAQASIFSGPEVPRAEAMGFRTLVRLDDVAPLPESGIITGLAKLERDREQVRRVVRTTIRTLQYLNADREGSIPLFMQFLGVSREEAEQAYDSVIFSSDGTVSERSLRYTIESEKKQLELTDDVPFSRVADFGPLYQALGDLDVTPPADSAR